MLRRTLLISAVALVGAGISVGAGAFAQENYPTRPITLVVPYAPGGATDIIGRVVAEEVSNTIGQRVIVENRPGAAGSLGAAAVSRADPDGYTLLMGALTSHSINMSLQAKPGFDLKKNFAPITLAGNVGLALVVNPTCRGQVRPGADCLGKGAAREAHLCISRCRFAAASCRRDVQFHGRHQARSCPISRQRAGDDGHDWRACAGDVRHDPVHPAPCAGRQTAGPGGHHPGAIRVHARGAHRGISGLERVFRASRPLRRRAIRT